ncbi:type II secretion system F family protein [Isoptericola sediminis]|uniref:type II secretion system F family protein n=1 Tax=Isoptericola sediminis TaxID=2733572 RepID=UPI0031B59923
MIAVVVGGCVLVGLAPWWWTPVGPRAARRRGADRRGSHGPDRAGRPVADDPGGPVDVAVLLELVATAVRSGVGVPRALEAVGSAVAGRDGRTLRAVAASLRLGGDWHVAWEASGGVRPGTGTARLAPLRDALRSAWTDGVAPGESLRAAAAELNQRRRAAARSAAGRLAVRLVLPLGLCFLPAFVLLGLVPVLLSLGVDLVSG